MLSTTLHREYWNGGSLEKRPGKSDGVLFFSGTHRHLKFRSHSAISGIPALHFSTIPQYTTPQIPLAGNNPPCWTTFYRCGVEGFSQL
jgi:hypothetical protein